VAGSLAPDVDHAKAHAAKFARTAGSLAALAGVLGIALLAPAPGFPLLVAVGLGVAVLPWLTRPRNGHFRGVVHSVWGWCAIVAVTFIPTALFPAHWPPWAAFAVLLGWASHLALDALTVEGLPLAWPSPARYAFLPKAQSISTGGKRPSRVRSRKGRARKQWLARRKAGAEYWLVQPALTLAILGCAFATVKGYQ
jgi:hypothetical protein